MSSASDRAPMTGMSSATPLFILLSHAFQTLCRIYTEAKVKRGRR